LKKLTMPPIIFLTLLGAARGATFHGGPYADLVTLGGGEDVVYLDMGHTNIYQNSSTFDLALESGHLVSAGSDGELAVMVAEDGGVVRLEAPSGKELQFDSSSGIVSLVDSNDTSPSRWTTFERRRLSDGPSALNATPAPTSECDCCVTETSSFFNQTMEVKLWILILVAAMALLVNVLVVYAYVADARREHFETAGKRDFRKERARLRAQSVSSYNSNHGAVASPKSARYVQMKPVQTKAPPPSTGTPQASTELGGEMRAVGLRGGPNAPYRVMPLSGLMSDGPIPEQGVFTPLPRANASQDEFQAYEAMTPGVMTCSRETSARIVTLSQVSSGRSSAGSTCQAGYLPQQPPPELKPGQATSMTSLALFDNGGGQQHEAGTVVEHLDSNRSQTVAQQTAFPGLSSPDISAPVSPSPPAGPGRPRALRSLERQKTSPSQRRSTTDSRPGFMKQLSAALQSNAQIRDSTMAVLPANRETTGDSERQSFTLGSPAMPDSASAPKHAAVERAPAPGAARLSQTEGRTSAPVPSDLEVNKSVRNREYNL